MTTTPWRPGTTVDTHFRRPDGTTGGRHPMTVVEDDGTVLLGWVPEGTPILSGVLTDGRGIREAELEQRFRLPRKLIATTWNRTSTLRWIDDRRWSSVWWFFDGLTGEFIGWYVNLEIPLGRGDLEVNRSDGILDVQVSPDGSWHWKDEDEFAAAQRAGRITPHQAIALRAEGEIMGARAAAGEFPFDGTHVDFGQRAISSRVGPDRS